MSELPEGWTSATIAEVTNDIPNVNPERDPDKEFGYVDISSVDNSNYSINGVKKIRGADAPSRAKRPVQTDDVLFSNVRTYLRNIAIVPEGSEAQICSTGFTVLRSNGVVDSRYLFRWVLTDDFIDRVTPQQTGTHYPATSDRVVKSESILIPPLNEQRRIVAKLEKLLSRVDGAQVRLATIPRILKRFRQSVLAAACSGRLTADWREKNTNAQSAIQLFADIQAERKRSYAELCKRAISEGKRKPKSSDRNKQSRTIVGELLELPETWSYFRLEDLSHLVTDGTHKTPKYVQTGRPFLSVKNVRPFLIKDSDIKYITDEEHLEINTRCNPERGDILYTKVGTFGYAAENTLDYPFSIFVSLALVKPVTPMFSSKFAELVMNSELVFSQARDRVSGIGTPDLHLIEIRDFRVPLPPIAEQQEIVRRVEALFKIADTLEARYHKAKAHVDKLTQSILAKAFRGDLVPQDPNDEPASTLLERIRQSKGSASIKKRRAGQ